MEGLKYWLWLTNVKGMGNVKVYRLLKHFKTPKEIWLADQNALKGIARLSNEDIRHLNDKSLKKAEEIMQNMKASNIRAVTMQDAEYPERLKHIYSAPAVLYIRGQLKRQDLASVAIVGSRRASHYGRKVAEKLAYQLAERGITVVSGMARGIDTSAHKGALKTGQRSIAVLGCGVDIVYPKENREMMAYIAKSGAVLSEYCPGTPPNPQNFPARNRIISGLSLGTVVVEAGERSGSLITADFALEQGRDVFAVPGNIDSYASIGANNLIKQGAKLVSCVEDILEELPEQVAGDAAINNMELSHTNNSSKDIGYLKDMDLSSEEEEVIKYLSSEPLHIDALCIQSGYNVQKLNAVLTLLEMRGIVNQLPGKRFVAII
ncbi:MAG: DNA-processing protein DprA [Firmicutes bacterium]|nr:DNA-processing protein DprA [Bacillota bacterium]